jgi:hypothetical protein
MNTTTHDISTGTTGPGVARVSVRGQFGFPELAGTVIAFDLENDGSPCYVQEVDLSSGNNAVTVPASAGGVVIVPPSGNTADITFKGINGDTGVKLHKTAPTTLSFDSTVSAFVLNASATVTGLQLIWL